MLVFGELPDHIRVTREQYLGMLSRLESATHGTCVHESELAFELIDELRTWFRNEKTSGEINGQLELPLEWGSYRAKG